MAKTTGAVFPGMIIMYDSDGSLEYYRACDGTGGRPDLRDKIIVGAGDTYDLGDTGGVIPHKHSITGTATSLLQEGSKIKSGSFYRNGGTASVNATETSEVSVLPPYNAMPFWQVVTYPQGVPNGGVVWWDGTSGDIPTGWSVAAYLQGRFSIGAGNLYSRRDKNAATGYVHGHGSTALTGSYTIPYAMPYVFKRVVSGGDWADNVNIIQGTWSGAASGAAASFLPPFYALWPIENTSGGTRGITSGMVLLFNAAIGTLPAGYSEFTAAQNRFIMGVGEEAGYDLGETGGSDTHTHAYGGGGGTGDFPSGTHLLDEDPDGDYDSGVNISANTSCSSVSNFSPYHALYLVKKD